MAKRILILVALETEAAGIMSLDDSFKETHPRVFQNKDDSFTLLVTGIGMVQAAMRLTQFLTQYPSTNFDLVLNIGYAGALDPKLENGQIFQISSIIQHDSFYTTEDHEVKHFPSGTTISSIGQITGHLRVEPVACDLPGKVLLSGNEFVSCSERKKMLSKFGHLVDMEAAALFHVTKEYGLCLSIVKIVTDGAETEDHLQDFLKNEKLFSHLVGLAFCKALGEG